ncbi:MAG: hypothetical protein NVSMB27_08330 [Ktedonobacteraceae bacterium]
MKSIVRWRPFALFALALLGLALRLYGLNWDQGNSFQPDERQILFHVTALSWPNSFAQFLDPVNSPLNPHFFAYGTFPLYLLAALGNILSHFYPDVVSLANLALVGRTLNAIFECGTILLTGWLALLLAGDADTTPNRRYAWSLALLSAALVTFTPFQLQLSHFYAVDTMLLFFVMLTILACVALVHTNAPLRWSLIAGLGYGLALATKISAAPLLIPLIVALLLRWHKHDLFSTLILFFLTIATTGIVFLIAMPYALLDWPNFVQQLSAQGDLARGLLDLPYVRQFAGTLPYLYEAQNILFWGMGLALGLAAFAGLLWLLWRTWKRDAGPWLVVLSWVIVYSAITGDFYVKFMRYMLPIYPFLTLMAAALLLAFAHRKKTQGKGYQRIFTTALPSIVIGIVLLGTIFQGLALLNVYSQPNTRIQASLWIYSHITPGSVLTYEQWDDPLPVVVGNNAPSIYKQATYSDANAQQLTGLDLYGDDTTDKARQLANLLPTINVITMATDRLHKSIPRLPFRYPLTIHYYQLLFSGQLGFHLAAQFENHPNLLGLTLDDSNADESYSVFDHPTSRIFVRDNPYPYTSDQLFHKLLDGIQLPPLGAKLSGDQRSLLLTPQQIADNQQSPAFSTQFPADSVSNAVPVFFWWLALIVLGLLTYPIVFPALRAFSDHGYIFSKTLGMLFLAYFAWLLASLHILAFGLLSLLLVTLSLLTCAIVFFTWQRHTIRMFLLQHWRLLLLEEGIFTLAYLLFVGIRSLNPDLWHIYLGGEKPMELAFLNAILRSPYMPPLDPWFAGGYINYYYYGYVLFAALIKLTGIVPTTAFNLAMPTLFALTFTGVVTIVYSFSRRLPLALLGGYFAALIGNFNGLAQLKGQLTALLAHMSPPAFDYWKSSRIITFTINEFPFWSFLFADLHPHVIDLPIAVLMLGLVAALLLPANQESISVAERRGGNILWYLLAAFVFGTIACVNPWDMPVYALILAVALMVRTIQEHRLAPRLEMFVSLAYTLVTFILLCGLGYLLYFPFFSSYEQLYVNGLGLVTQGTSLGDYLSIFGLWIFITLTFFIMEFYRWWKATKTFLPQPRRIAGYLLLCGVVLTFVTLLGLKTLLIALISLGAFLFLTWIKTMGATPGAQLIVPKNVPDMENMGAPLIAPKPALKFASFTFDATTTFTYLLLLIGLCITLGQEIVYVRDFLDGGDYYRMNTVFKFSMQAWLCLAIGGALAVQRLYKFLSGMIQRIWLTSLIVLIVGCSVFLSEGTAARINDHQAWAALDGQHPVQSANYTPTLDGFAFVRSWYPGDAQAITWLNDHVSGSPILLEASVPVSYQWYNRVSVFTGLPDVLGWPDHVGEQRYDYQPLNRETDINIIYTTTDSSLAIELLRYYHVHYIYVGLLEQQLYGQQSTNGLAKFNKMVGTTLRIVYQSYYVTIYEMV